MFVFKSQNEKKKCSQVFLLYHCSDDNLLFIDQSFAWVQKNSHLFHLQKTKWEQIYCELLCQPMIILGQAVKL